MARGRAPGEGLRFRWHGQWCGPGHSGVDFDYCDDELDCACALHDLAYQRAAAIEQGRPLPLAWA